MEKIDQQVDFGAKKVESSFVTDDKLIVRTVQDIEPNIEYATRMRNDDAYWKQGVKRGFAHAAHIPVTAVISLRQAGVDVYTASAKDIITGLKRIGMDHLITTRRRV